MRIINPSYTIEDTIDGLKILERIEKAGRTCYKSEDRITPGSSIKFVRRLLESEHESVIEHEKVTVRIICDRGISHELVRHRIGSYSQESTRYCNYTKDKFSNEITVIKPYFFDEGSAEFDIWKLAMEEAEKNYFLLLDTGATAQEARSVLPNSLKTEIIITYNLRQWRHFFKLRTSKAAHPQMREIAIPLLKEFKEKIPVIFKGIYD
jgi:thymidylate synthase (FAD)